MNKNKYDFFDNHYDCIIIGAGLAGLSSALQLGLKGKKCLVLEQHNLPGGVATSFVRGDIEIEATLHEMMSIGSEKYPLKIRKFLEECGVDIEWIRVPEAYRYVDPETNVLIHAGTHADFAETVQEIVDGCTTVPESEKLELYVKIKQLLELCNRVYNSVNETSIKPCGKLEMLFKHTDMVKTAGYSAKEVIDTFHLPQQAINILSAYWIYVGSPLDDLPFTVYAVLMADYLGYGSYVPKSFSHEMALKMAERAEEMGAQIEYRQRVDKILVKDNKVTGVRLSNGIEINSDYVICGSYPNACYTHMIEPLSEVPTEAIKNVNSRDLGLTCFSVVLLLDKSHEELGINDYSTFYAPEGFDNNEIFKNYHTSGPYKYMTSICTNVANPDATPKGTCIYSITALPHADGWQCVTEENYDKLKEKNARYFIEQESKRLGINLYDHIKEIVIEAPCSISHYTGAWNGSVYGYRHSMKDNIVARLAMDKDEKYIKGLAFAGAHAISGDGMSPQITNGRKAAAEVLKSMKNEEEK